MGLIKELNAQVADEYMEMQEECASNEAFDTVLSYS